MNVRSCLVAASTTLALTTGPGAAHAGGKRALPAVCAAARLESVEEDRDSGDKDHRERRWHRLYADAFEEIQRGELDAALEHECQALLAARDFAARDWRFAETLDELGYIHFLRGDLDASVTAQAAAVAEMLLALGPREPRVALYVSRLKIPLERLGRSDLARGLEEAPHRVFGSGLVAVDATLARRLDWLVGEYLATEQLTVARELQALVDRGESVPEAPER